MFLVIFALLSVAGGWFTWRRNPMYSVGRTLRFVGVTGLSIAAVFALIVFAVNETAGQSPGVVVGAALGVVIVGACGLIFVIQSLSTPKPAALLPSVPLVHTHRQRIYKWTRNGAISLIFIATLGILLPGNAGIVVLCFGGIGALGAIMMFAGYIAAHDLDRSLTSLEANPWIHWRYSPEQRKQWIDAQVGRAKPAPKFNWKREGRGIALVIGLFSGSTLLFLDAPWKEKGIYVFGFCVLIAALVALAHLRTTRSPSEGPAEVYLGEDGMFDGEFNQWLGVNQYLTAASIDERQPRSLLFRFEKIIAGGSQIIQDEQYVLIPTGADAAIADLQHKLAARCPKARIAIA